MFDKKSLILVIIFVIINFVIMSNLTFAVTKVPGQESLEGAGKAAGYEIVKADIIVNVQDVLNLVLGFVGFIFFGFVFYGGVRWMTARGKDELKQKAQDAITNAVIGLI